MHPQFVEEEEEGNLVPEVRRIEFAAEEGDRPRTFFR